MTRKGIRLLALSLALATMGSPGGAAGTATRFTILYSADERGEIEPCG